MRLTTTSNRRPLDAGGLSKRTALIVLMPLALIEFALMVYAALYGFKALGLYGFIVLLWNFSACSALAIHILVHKGPQAGGYMEVSNYLNLNKLGKD